jgi:hypothetical protein
MEPSGRNRGKWNAPENRSDRPIRKMDALLQLAIGSAKRDVAPLDRRHRLSAAAIHWSSTSRVSRTESCFGEAPDQ